MLAPRGSPCKIIGLIAAVASLSNFLEGYSSSYPNTAGDSFREFINSSYIQRGSGPLTPWQFTWFWSLLLNIWFVGYLAGTLCTPSISDTYGRKNSLCLANTISLLGTLLIILGLYLYIPELLIIGRSVAAIGSGLAFGSLILFIQETTPTSLRGTCSFLSEVSYLAVSVIGMGMGMDVLLGRNLLVLVGVGVLPGLLSILIVLPLKESPKFLLLIRGDREEALKALNFYQGIQLDNHSTSIDEIMKEMTHNRKGANLAIWKAILEVIKQPHLRKAVAIGTLALQIIVGIWPIIYISTNLLKAHFDVNTSQYSSLAFICANFFASIIGACTVERFGRRPLLIGCGIANTLCLWAYIVFDRLTSPHSIFYMHHQFKYGCVVSLIAYGVTYGTALGPIAFFITSELVPQHFRSLVQSIVFCVNTVINFAFSFITLPLYQLIDVWSFIPLFIIPSTFSIWYLIREMPETKGREIHEIVELLKNKGRKQADDQEDGDYCSTTDDVDQHQIPEILLPSCGPTKNSLIKSTSGGAAIATAIAKLITHQQIAGLKEEVPSRSSSVV